VSYAVAAGKRKVTAASNFIIGGTAFYLMHRRKKMRNKEFEITLFLANK
jgi:hypothetical protein